MGNPIEAISNILKRSCIIPVPVVFGPIPVIVPVVNPRCAPSENAGEVLRKGAEVVASTMAGPLGAVIAKAVVNETLKIAPKNADEFKRRAEEFLRSLKRGIVSSIISK